MSVGELVVITLAAAAGAMVQGSIGLGFTLTAGPALFMIDPAFAPGPVLLAGQLVSVRNILGDRGETAWNVWRRSVTGIPVGLVAGLALLAMMSERTLAVTVALLTIAAASALLAGWHVSPSPGLDVAAGGASAFSSMVAGLPGPPLVVAYSELEPRCMRGTSASTIFTVSLIAAVSLALSGNFGGDEAELLGLLMPGVVGGLVATRWTRPLIERRWFRPAVLLVALAGGVVLLARQLA